MNRMDVIPPFLVLTINKFTNNKLSDNDMHHKENTAVTECGGLDDGMIIVNCVHGGAIWADLKEKRVSHAQSWGTSHLEKGNRKCAKLEGRVSVTHSQTRKASSTKGRGGGHCSERRAGAAKHGSPVGLQRVWVQFCMRWASVHGFSTRLPNGLFFKSTLL